jgi:hypothetical protein
MSNIAISKLNSQRSQSAENFISFNQTILDEYNKELNIYAMISEYLINLTSNLIIAGSNSIIFQSTLLVQLTESSNQLTRLASVKKSFISFSKI